MQHQVTDAENINLDDRKDGFDFDDLCWQTDLHKIIPAEPAIPDPAFDQIRPRLHPEYEDADLWDY